MSDELKVQIPHTIISPAISIITARRRELFGQLMIVLVPSLSTKLFSMIFSFRPVAEISGAYVAQPNCRFRLTAHKTNEDLKLLRIASSGAGSVCQCHLRGSTFKNVLCHVAESVWIIWSGLKRKDLDRKHTEGVENLNVVLWSPNGIWNHDKLSNLNKTST